MKLRQLQFFIAVAEELSFSRAAIKLHVAQPSLSTQIKLLEEEVGAQLFERDKRHVSLTPAGRRFQQRAMSVLSMADSAKSEARSTARRYHPRPPIEVQHRQPGHPLQRLGNAGCARPPSHRDRRVVYWD